MKALQALGSGLIGACVLTLIHETVRRRDPDAPRMDVLGMEALAKSMEGVGLTPPPDDRLHRLALVGDLISNATYYSLVGDGSSNRVWLRGALLGLSAGLGAVFAPPLLSLNPQPSQRTIRTKVMTIAWYLAGGLAAAAAARLLARKWTE